MTVREVFDRYGPTMALIAAVALLVVLLPTEGGDEFGVGPPADVSSVGAPEGGGVDAARGQALPSPGAEASYDPRTGRTASRDPGIGDDAATVAGEAGRGDHAAQGATPVPAGAECRKEDGRQPGISNAMPPCVPVFSGDNGGATARGVSEDKIIVARYVEQADQAVNAALAAAGADDTPAKAREMYEAWRRFGNAHFETYGREVVFVDVEASGPSDNDAAMRADAIRIAEEIGAFAAMLNVASQVLTEELAQRDVHAVRLTSFSRKFYETIPQRVWSSQPILEGFYTHAAEYIGKRLWGRNAVHAGDDQDVSRQQNFTQEPRKFGLIWIEGVGSRVDPHAKPARDFFVRELAKYGAKLSADASYTFDLPRQQQQTTSMISKMRAAGASNIIFIGDPLYPIFLTQEATRQNYYPEWFITGTLLVDTTFFGRTYDQVQWRNAFGISPLWVFWENKSASSGYREFFHMRPDANEGDEGVGINTIRWDTQQIFIGIHMAGPNLTPDTFAQGMLSYPPTGGKPAAPLLDYTERDPNSIKDFTEVWWDPDGSGKDEADQEGVGILMKVDGGKRYLPGQWPATEPKVFDPDGAVFTTDNPPGGGDALPHEEDGHTHDPDERCRSCR